MPRETPCSPAELEERHGIIRAALAEGVPDHKIVAYCKEKYPDWGVADRTIRWYRDTVWAQMAEEVHTIDRKAFRTWAIDALRFQYYKANRNTDIHSAINAVVRIIDVLHLDEPGHEEEWAEAAQAVGLTGKEALNQFVGHLITANSIVTEPPPPTVDEFEGEE